MHNAVRDSKRNSSVRRSAFKGRVSQRANARQSNIGTVSKATVGATLETGWSEYGLYQTHGNHFEMS